MFFLYSTVPLQFSLFFYELKLFSSYVLLGHWFLMLFVSDGTRSQRSCFDQLSFSCSCFHQFHEKLPILLSHFFYGITSTVSARILPKGSSGTSFTVPGLTVMLLLPVLWTGLVGLELRQLKIANVYSLRGLVLGILLFEFFNSSSQSRLLPTALACRHLRPVMHRNFSVEFVAIHDRSAEFCWNHDNSYFPNDFGGLDAFEPKTVAHGQKFGLISAFRRRTKQNSPFNLIYDGWTTP